MKLTTLFPQAVRRIAGSFRLVGWISFWIQVVLGVVAGGILLFASATFGARSGDTSNPGTGTGLILASLGLIAVFVSAFWSFRYAQLGRRLRSRDASKRPSPKDALQALRIWPDHQYGGNAGDPHGGAGADWVPAGQGADPTPGGARYLPPAISINTSKRSIFSLCRPTPIHCWPTLPPWRLLYGC